MQIQVVGHQFKVSPALQQYLEERFEKLHRHYPKFLNHIHVTLSLEPEAQHKVLANLHLMHGETISAEAMSKDMYASIDLVRDKLERQVKDYKEMIQDHHKE